MAKAKAGSGFMYRYPPRAKMVLRCNGTVKIIAAAPLGDLLAPIERDCEHVYSEHQNIATLIKHSREVHGTKFDYRKEWVNADYPLTEEKP